jgi:hypothetical protein
MRRPRSLQTRQRGLTMISFLFVAAVLVAVAMLAMKVVPAYVEYFSVKKILATMGQEADLRNMSNSDIRKDFEKRASVGYVTVVKPDDLAVDRSSGTPVISASYQFRTGLIGNASLIIDFSASSDPSAAPPQIE